MANLSAGHFYDEGDEGFPPLSDGTRRRMLGPAWKCQGCYGCHAIDPSSITSYAGFQSPEWQSSAFVMSLSGQKVQRVAFNQPVRDLQ